jgi:AcrR family transcriptional regulator
MSDVHDLVGSPGPGALDQRESRRGEILAVAARQFAQTGYVSTSLREIADAAHILPGSLYHHFESKEAIAVELIEAMQPALEAITAQSLASTDGPLAVLRAFGRDVAAFSQAHRAAVRLCLFDAPSSATARLTELVRVQPAGLERTWATLVERADAAGVLRAPDVELGLLSLTLHHGILGAGDVTAHVPSDQVADTLTSVLLEGLWLGHPDLDSDAATQVGDVLDGVKHRWLTNPGSSSDGRRQDILEAAREEFARRGFDATTMRDVADAAGMKAGSLYRHFASKDELLATILNRFSSSLLAAMEELVATAETPELALDGLFGLMSFVGAEFRAEFDLVKVWWRNLTSSKPDAVLEENRRRFALIRSVLARGISDELFRSHADLDLLTLCVRDILWIPFHMAVRPERRHRFLRQTLGWGAAQT